MTSSARDLVDHVRDTLQALHAHYDLRTTNSTPRVLIGRTAPPYVAPFVSLAVGSLQTQQGLPSLHHWTYTLTIECVGYVAASTDSPEDRVLGALDLLDDITTALQASYALTTSLMHSDVHTLRVEMSAVDGDEEQIAPGYGVCYGTIEIVYSLTAGV